MRTRTTLRKRVQQQHRARTSSQYIPSYRQPLITQPARASMMHRVSVKTRCLLIISVVLAVGLYVGWSKHVSAHALAVRQAQEVADEAQDERIATAGTAIKQIIAANPTIMFGVSVQGMTGSNKKRMNYGATGDFDAASTAKLITAAAYFRKVEQGKASLSQSIDGTTAKYWLQQMIIQSDDTAWEELNNYLSHPALASYAHSLGMQNYDASDNQLTPADIDLLLQRLDNGTLLNAPDTALLMSYLHQANYRDYIVPAIKPVEDVYHKVGIDGDTVNDAAIITHGSQKLALVIFTNGEGNYDWPGRAHIMQSITRQVTEAYFTDN